MTSIIKNIEPRHVATVIMFTLCSFAIYLVANKEADNLRVFKEATK